MRAGVVAFSQEVDIEIPVVIFEDKMMYRVKGPVPAEDYTIPFGVVAASAVAALARSARAVTVSISVAFQMSLPS